MKYGQLHGSGLHDAARALIVESKDIHAALLLGGDRISCVSWGMAAYDEDHCVGLATFAANGEENSGQPTVVGAYVLPAFRRSGVGSEMLRRLIETIPDDFGGIRVDVITSGGKHLIEKLPDEMRSRLKVIQTTFPLLSLL